MSDDLIKRYRALAAAGEALRGLTMLRYADAIGSLLKEYKAKTVLDYGCGAGDAYRPPYEVHLQWGIERPIPYDPAFPKYARPVEGRFDAVICIDVLEHLTDDNYLQVLDALFEHAGKLLFVTVCCRSAQKYFPDGTNLHTLVRPFWWWEMEMADAAKRTGAAARGVHWQLRETP